MTQESLSSKKGYLTFCNRSMWTTLPKRTAQNIYTRQLFRYHEQIRITDDSDNSIRATYFHPGVERCGRTCIACKIITTHAGTPPDLPSRLCNHRSCDGGLQSGQRSSNFFGSFFCN